VRVWIDDQHPIFRRGLGACLQSHDFDLTGESAEFAPEPPTDRIDMLVFDAEGYRLGRAVRHVNGSGVRLVAVVPHAEEQVMYEAVDAGVSAILVRGDLSPASLVSALSAVDAGNAMLPAKAMPKVLERAANGSAHRPRSLAPRELAVLQLLAGGNDTRGIADELCYSERTVKNIVHDVLMKMNCRNRAHAVAVATRRGII
jgi:DNA-binding NarL/FixJ family response regulator